MRYLISGLLIVLLFGCETVPVVVEQPIGFAAYPNSATLKAISPDRVLYRVRVEENKPFANLKFWKTALKKRMLDAGYHFVSDFHIKSQNNPGYIIELAAPVGNIDYMYLVAILLNDKSIVIVESSGEISRFRSRREAVVAAIKGLDIKAITGIK